MNTGWTFLSLNVVADDMSINTIFNGLTLTQDDHFKNQHTFTDYYLGYGFYGGLTVLNTNEMYAVRLMSPVTVSVTGMPVTLPKSIVLNSGWTFMPCPYQTHQPLADAVPVFSYAGSDQMKSQSEFSTYYEGFGWYGSLTQISPGVGYKIQVARGGTGSFQLGWR